MLGKKNQKRVFTLILASWAALPSVFSWAWVQVWFPWEAAAQSGCGWRKSILRQLHYSCFFFPNLRMSWGALRSLCLTSRILTPSSQVLSSHRSTSPLGPEAVRGGHWPWHIVLSFSGCTLIAACFSWPPFVSWSSIDRAGESLQNWLT